MLSKTDALLIFLLPSALARPLSAKISERQSCPNLHVFGARETAAPAGYGLAETVVNLMLGAYSGSTAEPIDYPATGEPIDDPPTGGDSYGASVQAGVQAVTSAVTSFAQQCPDTPIVLVGYSQGAQIMDDAMCGSGDLNQGIADTSAPIASSVGGQVWAIILMGDPRHTPGAPYNVGTSTAPGFDPRPSGQTCTAYASTIQSYCDATDPYCSNGNDASVHRGYGQEYGQQALEFVNSNLYSYGTSSANSSTLASFSAIPLSTLE
ncbi:carbohydrate esterase family 5 protein [Rhizodiscina lignyota]|uniref:Carbohydrate esterase family 5 protein n=1 Tax=Rhizodiscina lignyota TaxID=1504668 RepID=A0A9P4IBS7_9PEZI|nr:carbohydrate esterase family 5 protein [Rhizodiscina lignyota]